MVKDGIIQDVHYMKRKKPVHYCSICKEGIYNGEEYIVNDDNEYAHWECVDYGRDLAKFLGYKVKEMNV